VSVRTLFVGCGNHGGKTLLPAALSAGINVTALVDTDLAQARRLARQWSIPQTYASVDDLDTQEFDAVVLALPIFDQAVHLDWALHRRLHTFVEKPPAPDLKRLRVLAEDARAADVVCCVGMNFRASTGVLKLLAKIGSGRFG
jgi:predicted dehydrogenase